MVAGHFEHLNAGNIGRPAVVFEQEIPLRIHEPAAAQTEVHVELRPEQCDAYRNRLDPVRVDGAHERITDAPGLELLLVTVFDLLILAAPQVLLFLPFPAFADLARNETHAFALEPLPEHGDAISPAELRDLRQRRVEQDDLGDLLALLDQLPRHLVRRDPAA